MGILPRRQDLPPHIAILCARSMHASDQIIVISYCWLSKKHPDPQGHQLQIISRVLDEYVKYWKVKTGIFLDWCSLYQDFRTPLQYESFKRALMHSSLWYAHQDTLVWMLTCR